MGDLFEIETLLRLGPRGIATILLVAAVVVGSVVGLIRGIREGIQDFRREREQEDAGA